MLARVCSLSSSLGLMRRRCGRGAAAAPDRCHAVFPCALQRAGRTAVHAVLLQRAQSRAVHSRDRLSLWREFAAHHRNRAVEGRRARNMSGPTTISTPSAICLRNCAPAGRRRRPTRAREGMQMTVRFSFKRAGEIIAAPRLTFATAGVSADIRDDLSEGDQRLARCLRAVEIHRWPRRRARRAPDRDPLCR